MADNRSMQDDKIQDEQDDVVDSSPLAVPLPQDVGPLSEPDDLLADEQDDLDATHPVTDTNIEIEEEYDEGLGGAAEAGEPNKHDAVIGYNPEADRRRQHQ